MKRYEAGFSLIEVMVAVLIMAVGVLGVAGLQVVSLQQNRSALFRAEAVQLANDLMDRIRVNTLINYSALIDAEPTAATDCVVNSCSRVQMAAFDISVWKCSINSLDADGVVYPACDTYRTNGTLPAGYTGALPNGAGSVQLVGGVYEVIVQWSDDQAGNVNSISLQAQVN